MTPTERATINRTRRRRRAVQAAASTSKFRTIFPVLGAPDRCWCGDPHGHCWAGKDEGAPHPR